jgi:TMEM175 potassium channel family protein
MDKGRLEAFSDGVIAVIITIMVLELHPPHEASLGALLEVAHPFLAYVLSFVYVGIYWNNHHHMFQTASRVNGRVLWANNFLLFCLSLVPFVTNWVGETNFALWPMVIYGVALFLPGFAYFFLATSLIRLHGTDSLLAQAMGRGYKEWASLVLYALGIGACFIHPYLGFALYGSVAGLWFIPDRRIEHLVERKPG